MHGIAPGEAAFLFCCPLKPRPFNRPRSPSNAFWQIKQSAPRAPRAARAPHCAAAPRCNKGAGGRLGDRHSGGSAAHSTRQAGAGWPYPPSGLPPSALAPVQRRPLRVSQGCVSLARADAAHWAGTNNHHPARGTCRALNRFRATAVAFPRRLRFALPHVMPLTSAPETTSLAFRLLQPADPASCAAPRNHHYACWPLAPLPLAALRPESACAQTRAQAVSGRPTCAGDLVDAAHARIGAPN